MRHVAHIDHSYFCQAQKRWKHGHKIENVIHLYNHFGANTIDLVTSSKKKEQITQKTSWNGLCSILPSDVRIMKRSNHDSWISFFNFAIAQKIGALPWLTVVLTKDGQLHFSFSIVCISCKTLMYLKKKSCTIINIH